MEKGLIHIYCGDGKGKTTAALGLAIRAVGANYKVIIVQFLKAWNTSELKTLKTIENVTVINGDIPPCFSWDCTDEEKAKMIAEHNKIFNAAIALSGNSEKTLLIFDELIGAYEENMIDRQMVLDFLNNKPFCLEIVLTGRNPAKELLKIGDYISEIKMVKHPIDDGVQARKGIEF